MFYWHSYYPNWFIHLPLFHYKLAFCSELVFVPSDVSHDVNWIWFSSIPLDTLLSEWKNNSTEANKKKKLVVIALASHLHGPSSTQDSLSLLLVLYSALRCFSPGNSSFPLSSKIHIFKFQFDWVQDLPQNHFRASVVGLPE